MDKSNEKILSLFDNEQQPFLTDLTKDQDEKVVVVKGRTKVKKKINFDERRVYAEKAVDIFETGTIQHRKYAERIRKCGVILEFGWVGLTADELVLKLKSAYFCRVRNCPFCQWRRSQMWSARFFEVLPRIFADYPDMRFIFLTLTVANCHVSELRSTVQDMNSGWDRMSRRKKFPALGYVRSLEVTKEKNLYDKSGKTLIRAARPDYSHPHFHVLMAVPSSYFSGRNYLSKDAFAEMWQDALRVDYKPVVDVRIVKPKEILTDGEPLDKQAAEFEGMKAALVEVVKYTVKPEDMVDNPEWFLELVNQLHKTRAVSLGGIFKEYLKVDDDGGLITKEERAGNEGGLMFRFLPEFQRYRFSHFKNKDSDAVRKSLKDKSKWGRGFYRPFDWFEVPHFSLLSPRVQHQVIQELGF